MSELPSAAQICAFHQAALSLPGWPESGSPADSAFDRASDANTLRWITLNHRCNTLLWKHEDQARRRDVSDAHLVASKRAIDMLNQQRNDAIEAIDACILEIFDSVPARSDRWLNSESAGSIIDRLSILSLKIHHTGLQARRRDATAQHRQQCRDRLAVMLEQRRDLQSCFDTLLNGMRVGRCGFKAYRQFKMYNDPAFNPWLTSGAQTSPV